MTLVTQRKFSTVRKLKLGFVGGGKGALIGEIHANGARLSNRWDIVAGCLSSNPKKAKDSGREWLLEPDRIYTNFKEMAEAEAKRSNGIDAVVIATPNALHYPIAKEFIKKGINVISDKPLCINSKEANHLMQLKKKHKVFFGVTYPYTSHVMVKQAKAMIDSGKIGRIKQAHVEYFQEWAANVSDHNISTTPWRLNKKINGPSFTTADIGTHAFQLLNYVTGKKVKSLMAKFYVTGKPKKMEDTAFMHLELADKIPATLMISQVMIGQQCGISIRIAGDKGYLEWHQENPENLIFSKFNQPKQILMRGYGDHMDKSVLPYVRMPAGHPEALTDAWANLYLSFAQGIDNHNKSKKSKKIPYYPTIEEGAEGVRFVEAAMKSNKNKKWINL